MYLLVSKMQTQDSKTSQSQKKKKAPCLEIRKALLPRIQSSQTSELDDILLLRKIR